MNIANYVTFVKAHEKLVIIILAAFLLYRTGQGAENLWIHHEDKTAQQAHVTVTNDATSNQALAAQVVAAKTQQDEQFAKLNQAIAKSQQQLKQQQQADLKLTQQQILDRWNSLLPMKPGSVQQSGSNDTITLEAATQTVQALEQLPSLNLQISDLNAKLLIDDGIIGKQDDLITGLNKQIIDEKASHQADVNLEKAKAKRSWVRGFKVGLVVGAVAVEAVRVWAGRP